MVSDGAIEYNKKAFCFAVCMERIAKMSGTKMQK
jgi:hypothetical protein